MKSPAPISFTMLFRVPAKTYRTPPTTIKTTGEAPRRKLPISLIYGIPKSGSSATNEANISETILPQLLLGFSY